MAYLGSKVTKSKSYPAIFLEKRLATEDQGKKKKGRGVNQPSSARRRSIAYFLKFSTPAGKISKDDSPGPPKLKIRLPLDVVFLATGAFINRSGYVAEESGSV